ncbi:MAG: PAS domain-containing sensor histidine kinase [Ignavibacteria bacterium]|jgi:PAS domain S-box-containing protein|nr:PAS domain-containing sensor histidine kinase [Ignavibacteria bacterium]MCU7504375.1 PAS domain-containing sensor histidine kinase [Ignavibacteria bacterium]MCU7517598.1 PAS domain-containing sensor histidine kinase [Ignavibacteria bacterium]
MQTKISNIIQLIANLSHSRTAYLLKGARIEAFSGAGTESLFSELNQDINGAAEAELGGAVNWASFRELSVKTGLRSVYIKKLDNNAEDEGALFLVLFSEKNRHFSPFRLENVRLLEDFLCEYMEVAGLKNIKQTLVEAAGNIEAIIYSTDVKGEKYLFITDAVKKILGYSPSELMENPGRFLRRIEPKHLAKYREFINQLRGGSSATVEYQVKDTSGSMHFLRNSGFPVEKNHEIVRIDGVVSDITKEKETQLRLEKSEERFRLLIETANDLIFNLDSSGYFLMVNNYGALALGYKPEEMLQRHFLEFISDDYKAEIAIAFQQILKSDKLVSFDAAFLDKFGKEIFFEVQCRPTLNNGEITGMLGIGRDITQRRKDEGKLRELNSRFIEANRLISIERDRAKQQVSVLEELNKLKSDFISNISHELRTPLASVVGFAETITSDPNMPREMILEFSNIILSEGKRLAKLINDVLDFAKMEAGKLDVFKTEFDIVETLQSVMAGLNDEARQKAIALTSEIPEHPVLITADKERISQVIQHLVSNAIKFTGRDGRVTLIAQDFRREFEIIVSDTGIGIPSRDLPNIFQKFYKAARPGISQIPGSGIGLGLVKQIIDMHKGLISVQSEVNKGTTFIIKLPKSN